VRADRRAALEWADCAAERFNLAAGDNPVAISDQSLGDFAMNFDPTKHKALATLAAPDDFTWAAAIAEVESGWNPFFVDSTGLRRGLWGLRVNFVAQMLPEAGGNGAFLNLAHADPFAQAEAFRNFWKLKFGNLAIDDRLGTLHYHPTAPALWMVQKDSDKPDPDGFIAAVKAARDDITGAPSSSAAATSPASSSSSDDSPSSSKTKK
jgi:hypothetical protein